jgi:excisionase family DNA binding protein
MNIQTLKPNDIKAARELSQILAQLAGRSTQVQIGSELITMPKNVVQIMLEVMTQVANGQQVSVLPKDTDLTTAETADLLNVSRPYVVQLLNEGKLPFRMVGTHRRVLLEDAVQCKETQRKKSLEIMAELSKEAQDLGYGY